MTDRDEKMMRMLKIMKNMPLDIKRIILSKLSVEKFVLLSHLLNIDMLDDDNLNFLLSKYSFLDTKYLDVKPRGGIPEEIAELYDYVNSVHVEIRDKKLLDLRRSRYNKKTIADYNSRIKIVFNMPKNIFFKDKLIYQALLTSDYGKIEPGILPESLLYLVLEENNAIEENSFPKNLIYLNLGNYNDIITEKLLPRRVAKGLKN